jgi:hypothetical protein
MKESRYKQCSLERNGEHHMAWIPERFAVVGKYIKIKRDNGSWDDGWKVTGNGGDSSLSAKEADNLSQVYKKTRKASDI